MLKTSVPSNYAERRKKLMGFDPQGCFVFFGASEVVRNNYHHYPFRQESHFYYLSEFEEPGAIMVLCGGKSILFCKERIERDEVWDGEIYGPERAKSIFAFDETYILKEFDQKFDSVLSSNAQAISKIYHMLGRSSKNDERILKLLGNAKKHFGSGRLSQLSVDDPTRYLSDLRMVKDNLEIERLRQAAAASVKAHAQLVKCARVGMNEKDLFAEFQYTVLKNGGTDLGYNPIVASGFNATTLHYTHNNETLKAGELILVDAGAENEYYTADLTHTFPVSAQFTEEQKLIYQAVLDASHAVIAIMKPGVTFRQMQERSVEVLTEKLIQLGVLTGTLAENIEKKTYKQFYLHSVGHHLGIDVHDAGIYDEHGKDRPLSSGMVLTVEPGLYFRDRATSGRFFGIGIRIEDDVLITPDGVDVLTGALPRDISAIEALRAGT